MKVPLSWLKEFVDIDATAEELAQALTDSGTEVESIQCVGGGLDDLIVGEILEIGKHPNADRLRLCKVNQGAEVVNVVCGAHNFSVGDKAAFAPVGATLPDGTKIKRSKIRGEESRGMLCAEDELGLSASHEGILLLGPDAAPGTPLNEVLPPQETVLTLEITWNRPDLLSIMGVAREVAAIYGLPHRVKALTLNESETDVGQLAEVSVHEGAACSRYTARVIQNVVDGQSPDWMRRRLELCGLRSISCLVDVTNYVLIECGQPLHAFDYDQLADHRINVRCAQAGERMVTLDGIERSLMPDMTLICDGRGPVALAGVMGGDGSEIRPGTANILLESATFDAPSVRSTSSALNLSSESSHRYERGVDPELADWASRRAAILFQELAGGEVARGVIDCRRDPPRSLHVKLRFDAVRKLLGMPVTNEDMEAILERLQLPLVARDAASCVVDVPSFRFDITIEADLIEEIARLYGLDALPDVLPSAILSPHADDRIPRAVMKARDLLKALGLSEVMNYSFLSEAALDVFDTGDRDRRLRLPNPVSGDFSTMRPSLIPQVVETLGRNFSYQNEHAAIFEIGTVFHSDAAGGQGEAVHLCVGLMGHVGRTSQVERRPVSDEEMMSWIRGVLESLAQGLHAGERLYTPAASAMFDPKACRSISIDGKACGTLGLVASSIRNRWRISEPVAVLDVELMSLLTNAYAVPQAREIPMFPAIRRDIAMLVDESVTHQAITETVRRAAPPELTSVDLFDIFRSSEIGVGRKSLAYSLLFRSSERTLKDEEANAFNSAIMKALVKDHHVEIREG